MTRYTEFGYAQARLGSRHGERPTPEAWNRLTAITSLAPFLQSARKGPLRRWLLELGSQSTAHEIDLTLRRHFREHIDEVARWTPAPWRDAVLWTRHIIDLPALEYLLDGNPAPAWTRNDPALQSVASDVASERLAALQGTQRSIFLEAHQRGISLLDAWSLHWHHLWPNNLRKEFTLHLETVAKAFGDARTHLQKEGIRSVPVLEALEFRLNLLFRRFAHEPAAVFVHLGLTALLLQRLRGALAERALFPRKEKVT